jgi:hypothetical protein
MKIAFYILFLGLCPALMQSVGSAETTGEPTTNGLGVVIKSIRALPGHTEFDLEVTSRLRESVSVSQFSLATAARTVKLSHTNGFIWKVERPKIIEDPPLTDVDFTFLIQPGATNRITVATPPLTNVTATASELSAPADGPKEVRYELGREVGTISKESRQFKWVLCSGVGKTRIEWRKSQQP